LSDLNKPLAKQPANRVAITSPTKKTIFFEFFCAFCVTFAPSASCPRIPSTTHPKNHELRPHFQP
ncbi:MAG: hypothetical protein KA084_02775, partial [Brachymonas sp.]|nr:hypothetical protein [Brachymonas sp.]MBP7734296.1 hypothetical protein [Brachymonas sp.]